MPLANSKEPLANDHQQRYDIGSTYIYVGSAPHGTPTSSAVWYIRRTVLDSSGIPTETKCAFSVSWDGRASANYY